MSPTSKIFVRYKALGYVSNHIPVVTRYIQRRQDNLLVTCVGKSFHTYDCARFSLQSVSGQHPEEITCMAADNYLIFTAAGNIIYAWRRGAELQHEYKRHEYPVHLLLPFGPHLISVDEKSNLKVWNIKTEDLQLELEFKNETFLITAVMHPSTYLNKILLGSEQGFLQLWNLYTSKLIYTFKGWGSGINVMEQSPAIDVVGIGLKNGHIILHNLKFDEVIMEFQQDWGIVTSLTFRSDNHPVMASGTTQGHIVLWNLEEKKVFAQMLNVHDGAVSGLKCLPCEPLMVSSSSDNTLKLWIFDLSDGSARLLRLREGHSLPPSYIRFHGANGKNLLSAGGDSTLRVFNTVVETFNRSLGKASYNRKVSKKKGRVVEDPLRMPPIMKFTFETTRDKEWDNIAAIHMGIPEVTTWSYEKRKMGDLKLIHDRFIKNKNTAEMKYNATPVSVCLTHCGNFVVIGYTSGHCDRYNIQSGLHRGTYGKPVAHEGAVRGVATDLLNQTVVTGGSDKFIKWWNFANKNELSVLELEDGVSFFTHHTESSLTAVVLENFSIVIIDNEGRNIIRKFENHSGRITDAVFSPDSRWLISSAMDCCICTWDLPSGALVDKFKVDSACTSLSFSPTGEMLATTHVDYLGVYLWTNRTLYNHVSLRPINPDVVPVMSLPSNVRESAQTVEADDSEEEKFESSRQIENLITLSSLANSRWQNLLNLDVIKKRNKPIEPPKTPKAAPFFLPTIPSLDIKFDFSKEITNNNNNKEVSLPSKFQSLTVFAKALKDAKTPSDFSAAFEKLKSMGPSGIDFEVNSLSADMFFSADLLLQFVKMIQNALGSKVDFELTQAYLALYLRIHGETILESETLRNFIKELMDTQLNSWHRIQNELFYNLCVIQSLRS